MTWSPDDRDRLAAYLKKNPKFLQMLKWSIPKTAGKTFEEVAISASGKQEADNLIEKIEQLAISDRQSARPIQNVDVTEGLVR